MEPDEADLKFYRQKDQHGYLSNFYPSPFTVKQIVYKTNQHFFQSKKFEGHPHEKTVVDAPTPSKAFSEGRTKKFQRRKDWEQVKESVMLEGLTYKFMQNLDLKKKLMQTGNRKLIEHTKNDNYWGDGGDGSGKNRLGILLMKVREQIKGKETVNQKHKKDQNKVSDHSKRESRSRSRNKKLN